MTKIQIDKQVRLPLESDVLLTRLSIHGLEKDEESCLKAKEADNRKVVTNLSLLSPEQVVMENDRVDEAYEIKDGKRQRKGYSYDLSYRVQAEIGKEKAIEQSLEGLHGKISFRHTYVLKDPDEGKKIALDMAIQKAREMASTIAQSLGMKVVSVEEVATEDYPQGPVLLRANRAAMEAGHESTVTSHVHIVFLAE